MVAYVIIPGIDGSDDRHWQTLWEREWRGAATRISPDSWSEPDLDGWTYAIQKAYDGAAQKDGDVVLVAHSLGCWAAATWLYTYPSCSAVRGAFLVAPPDPEAPAFPARSAPTFVGVSAQPLPCAALTVGSSDDPYCSPQRAAAFAAGWKAQWQLAGAYGHINSASGLGSWPQGLQLLASLTQPATSAGSLPPP